MNPRYLTPLSRILKLETCEREFLRALVESEHVKTPVARARCAAKIDRLAKVLRMRPVGLPNHDGDRYMAAKVFCAFGLFRSVASIDDLVKTFGQPQRGAVRAAIAWLLQNELIERDGARYRLRQGAALFSNSEDGISHLDFTRMAIGDAGAAVASWFRRPHDALFQSLVLSVNGEKYKQYVETMRQKILEDLVELSDDTGDQLIQFNIQVYPLSQPTLPGSMS